MPNLYLPDGPAGYKGGVARIALKAYLYSKYPERFPVDTLTSELPFSDVDVIIGPGLDTVQLGIAMGADVDGIEHLDAFDITRIMLTRNCDINQVLVTKYGLYFTQGAYDAMLVGTVASAADMSKGLFGKDVFFYIDKKRFVSPRGMQRLVKFVCEGKAQKFSLPAYNFDIPMGIYWLVLLRKFIKKDNADQLIYRLYSIACQMDQTKTTNPNEFIHELFEQYPNFSFEQLDSHGVVQWILTRFVKSTKKHLQQKFDIYDTDFSLKRGSTIVDIIPQNDPNFILDPVIRSMAVGRS